jgi:hypothetical protein
VHSSGDHDVMRVGAVIDLLGDATGSRRLLDASAVFLAPFCC